MIYSMTAFARASFQQECGHVVWEMRTVNHRYLDMHIRLPEHFREWEPSIREMISARLHRGKVDCQLQFSPGANLQQTLTVNTTLVDQLINACHLIETRMQASAVLKATDFLRWPDVLQASSLDITSLKTPIFDGLTQTLDDVVEMRAREGQALMEAVLTRLDNIQDKIAELMPQLPACLQKIRDRLIQRLNDLAIDCDSNRLEQEMVLLAQKADVAEEIDRLQTHVKEVRRLLKQGGSLGRKLDFLMQELNREANTLASKAIDTVITRAAVDIKVWIEQMREQVQNIA